MSSIKLKGGGYVKLDKTDYDKVKDFVFYAYEINTKAGPRMVIKTDDTRYMYLHCILFNNTERKNKILLHLDNNIFNYERKNLVLVPSNRRKKIKFDDPNTKEFYYTKTPTVVCVIDNKCVIAPDHNRELICATCSYLNLEKYEICLDVAAKHSFPGWKILQFSDWCREVKNGITAEERSRSLGRKEYNNEYDNKQRFSEGDTPFSKV